MNTCRCGGRLTKIYDQYGVEFHCVMCGMVYDIPPKVVGNVQTVQEIGANANRNRRRSEKALDEEKSRKEMLSEAERGLLLKRSGWLSEADDAEDDAS